MAVARQQRPYVQFNFQVDLSTDGMDPASWSGGFQEVTGLSMEVQMSEYRTGVEKLNGVLKIPGMVKSDNVTLKRGIMGMLPLYNWINQIRLGDQTQLRPYAIITLMSEDHTTAVMTWKLQNARIVKLTYGPLNAKGTDVAMEEAVIAHEGLFMS
ncbi:MAG TPA: phage tail protein [Tepidisphaeraceae bacterium]|jgi:phage tail-like protein|nr:phage tail protein [Tepidisphaeraceae bacterium]